MVVGQDDGIDIAWRYVPLQRPRRPGAKIK
jgi:hypothetical protein